ncbi:MAG: DUF4468 domain-containing protein [Bacteroidota bacterium]
MNVIVRICQLLFLLVFGTIVHGQMPQGVGDWKVVEVSDASKNSLHSNAVSWIATAFTSANDVIQLNDKESGKIIVKGVSRYDAPAFKVGTNFSGYFSFMLTIEVKENKYRYKFQNLNHSSDKNGYSGGSFDNEKPACGTFTLPKRNWVKIKSSGYDDIRSLSMNLENSILQESSSDDDW